jgi:uncharacterized protein YycO
MRQVAMSPAIILSEHIFLRYVVRCTIESFISIETQVNFQQNKTNDDNNNNTNISNNQKSNNQPIANVDRATSQVGLHFSFGIVKKLNYY